jgi:hypothetical protein
VLRVEHGDKLASRDAASDDWNCLRRGKKGICKGGFMFSVHKLALRSVVRVQVAVRLFGDDGTALDISLRRQKAGGET